MRSLFPSLLIVLVTICAAAIGGPTQHDPADTFAFNSVPQVEHAALKTDNPLCKCQSCECLNCSCTPLEVGRPPDSLNVLSLKSGQVSPSLINLSQVAPKSEPPPGLIVPVSTVAKKASPPAASGHWETRSAGFRGRRSFQVWVPDAAGGACANGSCTSGACANGSLPGYTFNSGSCRSCR
jgi:hypothetical protein